MARPYPTFPALVAAMVAARAGGKPFPAPEVPTTLPAAIVARFLAAAALVALAPAIYQSAAGETAELPYVAFGIDRAPTTRLTSTSAWHDASARFDAFAETAEEAEAIAAAVLAAFKGATLEWSGGYAIPLVVADRPQAAEARRARKNERAFRCTVRFSARCREER